MNILVSYAIIFWGYFGTIFLDFAVDMKGKLGTERNINHKFDGSSTVMHVWTFIHHLTLIDMTNIMGNKGTL